MPFVPAKCPQCGGILEVDSEKDATLCKYCGMPFINEKAINNFKIEYNTTNISNYSTVNNIQGGVIHFHEYGESVENLFKTIEGAIKAENTVSFLKNLEKLEEKFPDDYRVKKAKLLKILHTYYKKIDDIYKGKGPESYYFYDCGFGKSANPTCSIIPKLFHEIKKCDAQFFNEEYPKFIESLNSELNEKTGETFTGELPLFKFYYYSDSFFKDLQIAAHDLKHNTSEIIISGGNTSRLNELNAINANRAGIMHVMMPIYLPSGHDINEIDYGTDDEFVSYILLKLNDILDKTGLDKIINDYPGELNYSRDYCNQLINNIQSCFSENGLNVFEKQKQEKEKKLQLEQLQKNTEYLTDFWSEFKNLLINKQTTKAYDKLSFLYEKFKLGTYEKTNYFKRGIFGIKLTEQGKNEIIKDDFVKVQVKNSLNKLKNK